MSKPESTYKTVKAGYDFREYVYSKNICTRILGKIFRKVHYRKFTIDVIDMTQKSTNAKLSLEDFSSIFNSSPNKNWYAFYVLVISRIYNYVMDVQIRRLYKKSLKDEEIWQ